MKDSVLCVCKCSCLTKFKICTVVIQHPFNNYTHVFFLCRWLLCSWTAASMTRNTNCRKTAKGSNSTTMASTVVSGWCILHIILNRTVNAIMYTYYIVVKWLFCFHTFFNNINWLVVWIHYNSQIYNRYIVWTWDMCPCRVALCHPSAQYKCHPRHRKSLKIFFYFIFDPIHWLRFL